MREFSLVVQCGGELFREFFETDSCEEDTCGVGGIAVAVLAAASRDNYSLVGVAIPVEQAHSDIGAIELCINIESRVFFAGEFSVVGIVIILFFNELPGFLPVVWKLLMPC